MHSRTAKRLIQSSIGIWLVVGAISALFRGGNTSNAIDDLAGFLLLAPIVSLPFVKTLRQVSDSARSNRVLAVGSSSAALAGAGLYYWLCIGSGAPEHESVWVFVTAPMYMTVMLLLVWLLARLTRFGETLKERDE